MAPEVEAEQAEERRHSTDLEPIIAAGKPVRLVCEFGKQRADRQRQHHQRHAGRVQDEDTDEHTEQASQDGGDDQTQQRVIGEMRSKDSRCVSTEAKEGGMAQRDDSGLAEREIEREREQDHDQGVGAKAEVAAGDDVDEKGQGPRQQMQDACEPETDGRCGEALVARCLAHAADFAGMSPWGRNSRRIRTAP